MRERDAVAARLRATAAAALLSVGVVLVPVAVGAAWGRWVVLDTERYTATVAPLAHDDLVRVAVRDRLVAAAVDAVDVERLADRLVAAVAGDRGTPELDLALRMATSVVSERLVAVVTDVVDDVLASPAFARAWESANRTAHAELVAVLRGEETAVVRPHDDGGIGVELSSVADAVGASLAARGLRVAQREVGGLEVVLVDAESLERLRGAYATVDVAARALPTACSLALAGGVLLARRRLRATALAATGVAVAAGLAFVALGVLGDRYVAAATTSAGARRAVFGQVSGSLRLTLGVVLGSALLAAAGAHLAERRRATG